jgi:hypothetical protein
MVNSILTAVTKQLGKTFGTSYRYYVENVEQGLKKPCFTVDMLLPLQRSRSKILYDRTMPLVIHYFSDRENNNKTDCYAMSEQIVECLEYLPFQNTIIRGEDISWQMVDDVLQIFITYRFITAKVIEGEVSMENLTESVSHT